MKQSMTPVFSGGEENKSVSAVRWELQLAFSLSAGNAAIC